MSFSRPAIRYRYRYLKNTVQFTPAYHAMCDCENTYHFDIQRQYSVTQALTVNNWKIPAGITRYETTINGQPVYGGANDPRMGDIHSTSDPG